MDPLNDLVWTDEDEGDIVLASIGDGTPMAQICTVNEASCIGSSGGGSGDYTSTTGMTMLGQILGCGC